MISKNMFCKAIDNVKRANEFDDKLYDLCKEYGIDLSVFKQPLSDTVLDILNEVFECEEHYSDIEYFCFDLNYGEDWEPGMITGEDGEDIDFSTSEKLYDYLLTTISCR